jgi:serine phosphatase RsbU (regulator of sigma subunit)
MHYVSAGHPPPLIYSTNNQGERKFSHLVSRGTVLGLTEFLSLKILTRPLASGEEIIAYTDGLPIGRHVRAANAFFADRRYDFAEGPKALLDMVWSHETAKTGRVLEDDVSIVWFKAS